MPRLSKIGAAALAAFGWTGLSSVSASYLVVAGGGSGANGIGGGGGAGGLLTGTASLNPALSYTITVGAGGTGSAGANAYVNGNAGSNSSALGVTATGGGYGGTYNSAGGAGGSGGGGGTDAQVGGTGVSGQGYAGGTANNAYPQQSGGGGGAGAVGANATNSNAGNGGVGVASSISGTSTYYAGGGGGSFNADSTGAVGSGGNGGGSAGGNAVPSSNATANTGGGSGGGGYKSSGGGFFSKGSGNGGSGVVIISYPAPQKFGGGIVTTSGSNVIHTFNTSGTLSPLSSLTASYLIVAGGGSGGAGNGGGGGGGAGGLLTGSGLTIDTNSNYVVTVGGGGSGTGSVPYRNAGSNSVFSAYATAAVGGGGGGYDATYTAQTGGSGGGGNYGSTAGAAGTSGQGNAGGNNTAASGAYGGGGGGGAGAVGSNGTSLVGGNGGTGTASSISGSSVTYAGGGGGGSNNASAGGTGGTGGGGNGGNNNINNATAATANTGGGGGAGGGGSQPGANGGSGVVIISYAGSTQQMAGGTVTITGGNVIHTFTSSGYLTPIKYVNNSLRFRSSASAYLNRTPSASSRTTWTWTAWVKRGKLGSAQALFSAGTGTAEFRLTFTSSDTIEIYEYTSPSYNWQKITTAVYRDPSAWYQIQLVYDTTNGTAGDRVKLYVNSVQVTSFGTNTNPTPSFSGYVNSAVAHGIGSFSTGSSYLDGYMTEINFIDGQALTPNSFGTFNSYGVWQPITYGGSYGTNGFYLPFKTNGSTYVGSFSTSWLTLASNTAFNVFGGDMTVECWFNATSVSSSPHLFAFVQDATNRESIYFNSGALTFYSSSSAGSGNRIATGTISTGVWYHYALVKSGSTFTMYLNGVAVGTSTTTQYSTANQSLQIGTYNSGSYGGDNFSGYISNVRVVKGTAVYTSNFIPPTANLSAVTNTQLLTLQNATIIDNSTNAFSITNTNTVTTGQTYPFSASLIFNDQSPQGNNWTPNNISGAVGSTLDYMTDVPTLTSATAANFCTLNPINKSPSSIVSNGNLRQTSSGGWYRAYSTIFFASTAVFYAEATMTALNSGANGVRVGIANANSVFTYLGSDANSWSYDNQGPKYNNGTLASYGASYVQGDVIGILFNNGSLTFYKNGASQGVAYSGLTGTFCFAGSPFDTDIVDWNFGQRPFSNLPSGALALNTYNL